MESETTREKCRTGLHKLIEKRGDTRPVEEIAEMLIEKHQFKERGYIGTPEELGCRLVHVPDESSVNLPGRAGYREEFLKANNGTAVSSEAFNNTRKGLASN